jgi:predicted metal-dependent phosphotriesterase family hydrolase
MSKINTVLGKISPDELGVCDFHEHLIRSSGPEIAINSHYLMDNIPAAIAEMDDYLSAGGRSLVCMDPIGAGRDVPKMLEIARYFEGRAHIVLSTGFHKGSLYDNLGHWSQRFPQEKVVDLIAKEVTDGMDVYSYIGPLVERCNARAGIIKAGTSLQKITSFEQNILTIVSKAQAKCGAAISIHTEAGTMGVETIDFLIKAGADIQKTVLCHVNKVSDRRYYQRMLDKGANLCFDGPDRPEWGPNLQLAENIHWLIEKGYESQILLSMDAGRSTFQKHYMAVEGCIAKGISSLLTDFIPMLKSLGVSDYCVDTILKRNPARVLAI